MLGQFKFRESDIGQLKAMVVAKNLQGSLDDNVIVGVAEDARSIAVEEFDFVLEGTDSLKTKFDISRKCQASNVPFIMGSIFRNTSQIYVFPNTASTHNMSDLFASADTELTEQSCSAVGVYAHQCMFTASIMVSECIKTILFDRDQALLIHCNLHSNTMTSTPVTGEQYTEKFEGERASIDLASKSSEPERVDLNTVNGLSVYDVRDEAEFDSKPGKFTNLPSRFIIRATNYDKFKNAVFVCASGKRAKLIAKHVNEIVGFNTARYGEQF